MLSKLNRMKEDREQGFTLIELLVVILIIGILAAIAIPMFLNQRKSAVDSSVQSDVSNASKQIETWIVKQGATQKDFLATPGSITITRNATTGATVTNPATGVPAEIAAIKISDGTTLKISGNSFGYFIQGTNPGGDVANKAVATGNVDATTTGFVYDSAGGGLKKK